MFNIRIPVLTFSFALLEVDIAYLEVLNNDIADDVGFLTAANSNCKNYDSKYNLISLPFDLLYNKLFTHFHTIKERIHTPVNLLL